MLRSSETNSLNWATATGRDEQQQFWKAIARGLSSEDAAVMC